MWVGGKTESKARGRASAYLLNSDGSLRTHWEKKTMAIGVEHSLLTTYYYAELATHYAHYLLLC